MRNTSTFIQPEVQGHQFFLFKKGGCAGRNSLPYEWELMISFSVRKTYKPSYIMINFDYQFGKTICCLNTVHSVNSTYIIRQFIIPLNASHVKKPIHRVKRRREGKQTGQWEEILPKNHLLEFSRKVKSESGVDNGENHVSQSHLLEIRIPIKEWNNVKTKLEYWFS